ncbi:MAG: S41 family peptidase [Bacteroidia bacterium]|nr:S41 family peptidase [Bacteroidia bacterium]
MKKRFVLALVIGGSLFLSSFGFNNDKLYEISKNIEIFIKVYKELNANYVDDIDPSQLMKVGLDAMVGSLDPYTNYISESEVTSYRISRDGKYEGIGAVVKKIDDYVTIIEPYANSPVVKAGLKSGDQIIAIEGKSTKGKPREEVTQIFRGVPGTDVNMTILRPGEKEPFDISLVRKQVNIPNVPYSGFVSDDVGYIALSTFTGGASKNIRFALRDLKNENPEMKGLILDLRNNGGGLLAEAIKICNIFLPKGQEVVSVKSKVRERDVSYKTQGFSLDEDIPIIVMINKKSASASEIVSGVIQDFDRGILMGQRSYGKGLVQNTADVGFNSQVKLTTSKYYIPSGRCIQSVEYEDGEPVDIPDEKRARFKTSNGRTVLDGGGVTPDYLIEESKASKIATELLNQNIIFKYVTDYMKNVEVTDSMEIEETVFEDFEKFKSFVSNMEFEYETENEKLIEKIKSNLSEDGNMLIMDEVNEIENKLTHAKSSALENNREEIINLIEEQIATRLYYQKGKAYQRLKNDKEVTHAIELFDDSEQYKGLLQP